MALSYETGESLVARTRPGDATARILDLRTAQKITLTTGGGALPIHRLPVAGDDRENGKKIVR